MAARARIALGVLAVILSAASTWRLHVLARLHPEAEAGFEAMAVAGALLTGALAAFLVSKVPRGRR